ncbi:hypothetical protein Tco_1157223 [Tanacetum coccineum]
MDDIVSSDEEWKESDYKNLPNKPYLIAHEKIDIEKVDGRSQKKRKGNDSNSEVNILNKAPKSNNMSNEQPNKRDLAGKKSTMLVTYLQSGILAH